MAVPILLVTGFLGAGKTTLINHLLTDPRGRRLAAVVNDFGAIDIDAELLAATAGDVVSLKNGCICCSLQGDLLRTLSLILRRVPVPNGIVIETSGVSDPAEIMRALLDPVIWREAALDAVLCVADARGLIDQPEVIDDPLCSSQFGAADFIVLNKADLVTPEELSEVRARLGRFKPPRLLWDSHDGRVAPELLFSVGLHEPGTRAAPVPVASTTGFQSMSWTSPLPISMRCFKDFVERLSARIVRGKGFVRFGDQPDIPMLFQMVGRRVTVSAAASRSPADPVQLVFIARDGDLDEETLRAGLARCVEGLSSGLAATSAKQ